MAHKVKVWLRFETIQQYQVSRDLMALTGLSQEQFINLAVSRELQKIANRIKEIQAKEEQENGKPSDTIVKGLVEVPLTGEDTNSAGLEEPQ